MARFNNKKLQTQRNFQSIWHSQPEYIGTLLKEDQHIREYIIGTMRAKGWKLSEIIIKRKVKHIHIAFQIQMSKIGKERKRWTKNRLKNRINIKGSNILSKRSKINSGGVGYISLASKSRLKKIAIKKRFLFFQIYLMITELRKMYPYNQISFYIQKTKPLQFNANLINSWIIENIKKKKSYKRLVNKIISKFKNSHNLNIMNGMALGHTSNLLNENKKEFLSWVTGNLVYLYKNYPSDNLKSTRGETFSNIDKQIKSSVISESFLKPNKSLDERINSKVNTLNQIKSKGDKANYAPIWLKWKVRFSGGKLSASSKALHKRSVRKKSSMKYLSPIRTHSKQDTSKKLISSLNNQLSPNWGVQSKRNIPLIQKRSLSITNTLNGYKKVSKGTHFEINSRSASAHGSTRNGELPAQTISNIKEFKGLNFNKEFKSDTQSLIPNTINKFSTNGGNHLMRQQFIINTGVNSKNILAEPKPFINQDLRSTWKMMRKMSYKQIARRGRETKINQSLKGVLKHRKEFNEDTLLLLNMYKGLAPTGFQRWKISSPVGKPIALEGSDFLWQGKLFIKWLQSHPVLLDHIIKCLVSSSKEDSLIEYLTRAWVGIFDYIYYYENSLFKWQGIRILLSGRVGYKKMGRAKKYSSFWGSLKNSSARLPLQYAYSQLHTRYGVVGVKVFVR